jgi:hypothetical protein
MLAKHRMGRHPTETFESMSGDDALGLFAYEAVVR